MALIECRGCAKQVSDEATACPSCGRSIMEVRPEIANTGGCLPKRMPRLRWKLKLLVMVSVVTCVGGAVFVWGSLFEFGNIVKAAAHGNTSAVRRLLWLGVDVNARAAVGGLTGKKKFTPLQIAAFDRSWGMCCLLLDSGADPAVADEEGLYPIHRLAMHEAYALYDIDGKTLLWSQDSNLKAQLETLHRLISSRAGVNFRDKEGRTALHVAVEWLNVDVVNELVKNGADVQSRDPSGRTPLHYLAAHNFLSRESVGSIFGILLDNGADVNAKTLAGKVTPLHDAAYLGEVQVAELLCKHGADVSAVASLSRYGKVTPLECALKAGKNDLADVIRKYAPR